MTWKTVTVGAVEFPGVIESIRHSGGVITSSRPVFGEYEITYVC
jgi:hypothetical protein